MKKLILSIVLVGIIVIPAKLCAQHNIVYSQYIFNGLLINPAYAGSHVQLSSTLTYRNQWINFEGAPETATFGIHSAFKKERVGLGLLVTNDKIGSYRNTGVYGSYAYIIKRPGGGVLSLGVQGGFNNFKADFTELNLKADADPIFNGFFNELRPNFGGGIFYYNKKMFAGFSVPTILKHADFFNGSFEQLALPRVYYLNAGTTFPIDRMEKVKVSPSFLLRVQEGTPLSADINLNVIFYDQISIGNSYRTGDAIVTFVSFKLSEKFHFVYSYDWTTSAIGSYSKGTHEFTINFRTRIRNVHKDVDCPYFYSH
ncbi:PorP/SprF family type IX secretion system membrane protein [Ohtaekwangia koreensis]|uniref:Type IX secretion system membrane protein, PorP/SprF family n=1 Tax=Ohtaekwangia koreensis TaxID=688867 RepID=A0A1T5KU03_9BACT|nr:type IX secretion system membrane protein PorP/SprF [Ohtaekwangia koreensis]SKC66935.1 type IX secretion system membrane protein, PorP/SprF family [Ohtaekwangia koreensis]